jgi:hypothetical protein
MNFFAKLKRKVREDNEKGARKTVLEELFYDFNRSRFQVYKMNFFRGIFFGLGSVLGGTVVIAIIVWLLSVTGALLPGVAGFVDGVSNSIQQAKR